jgi:uncharacterized protein YecE (DUF72 family)
MPHINWRIGCSGFAYREWKDIFYPAGLAQKNWFAFYATHFNTLELNVSFYRIPTLKSLKGWFEAAPEDFVFSAKVHRSITHYKKLDRVGPELEDFYGLLKEGLGAKLGCVLFQMPPQFSFTDKRLEQVLSCINPEFTNVFEFRHESWWRSDVQQALAQKHICFSGVSFPKITRDEAVTDLPVSYYRFHGVPQLFYSKYEDRFVEQIYKQVKSSPVVSTAYMYFNNTASAAALYNARYLQNLTRLEG